MRRSPKFRSTGKVRVHRVVCAVDCGQVVNPAIVAQQIQSGIVYGLTAALKGGITIDRGRVEQKNFNNYDVIRMTRCAGGRGPHRAEHERAGRHRRSAVPGIAPAVANALFTLTGKRVRRLPIQLDADGSRIGR